MSKAQSMRKTCLFTILSLVAVMGYAFAVSAQTLTVWVGDGDVRLREYEVVARMFEKQNPGIKVDVLSQAGTQIQVMQKLAISIAANAAPDLSWIEGSAVAEFAAQGLILDVTKAVDGIRFAPADTQEMTYNGRMWAVPYHTAARGLFKRTDLFEQAGLNPNVDPKSMEELYAWSQKLTKADGNGKLTQIGLVPWSGNWGAPGWIWTFGGKLVDVVGTKIRPTATDPKNVQAFEWIRSWTELYNNRPFPAGGFTGAQAITTDSTSKVGPYITSKLPFTTGRVPNPPGGQNGTWGGGTAVVVPMNAPNPQLSLKLARFFGETPVQIERFTASNVTLPANWQALLSVGRQLPQEYASLLDQFPEARPRPPLWNEYYVGQLNPAMNAVVKGTVTPQQALTNVQTVMEARFKEIFGN